MKKDTFGKKEPEPEPELKADPTVDFNLFPPSFSLHESALSRTLLPRLIDYI